jgi:hypothetical protein
VRHGDSHQAKQDSQAGSSADDFFNKIKGMADTLAAMGQPLHPEEFNAD